jgi:hypothetical protein
MVSAKRSNGGRRCHRWAHQLIPAFLVSASVLLVVEHWPHFETSDFVILALMLAACVVNFVLRQTPIGPKTGRDGSDRASGGKS